MQFCGWCSWRILLPQVLTDVAVGLKYRRNMTLELFKQCVSLIVATRSQMAIETEYSLCVLLEGAVQVLEFTTDTNRLLDQVRVRGSEMQHLRLGVLPLS
jgi:hypothetical protein